MLHFVVGTILASLFVTSSAWAKCDDSQFKYVRESGFSLSLGSSSFNKEETINIPLIIDGKPACYHQSNGISVKTEKIKEGESVEYEITPLSAEFENVPSSATYQYLNVEYDAENKASKVQITSFLCSGESPIGGDAFSDELTNLAVNEESSSSADVFIATGQAAENVSINQAKKARAKVFDKFLEIYEERADEIEMAEMESSNIYIPNVIAGISISGVTGIERKLYSSFFSRTNSSINGCSKKFLAKMKDYLLENVAKNQPFRGIELKKKRFSSKYKMKWTL